MNNPVRQVRVSDRLIEQAKLGLMLSSDATVSQVIRASLQLAAGISDNPDGKVIVGGYWSQHTRRYKSR